MAPRCIATDVPICLAARRCFLPIDNFFGWKAIKGQKTKQPYVIAMKAGQPSLWGRWEN